MAERVRFHLDEHVNPTVAHALRRHGADVTTTPEAGLRTRDDEDHLQFARATRRVIVTHDADFLRIASQTTDHWGVAYCHRSSRSVGGLIRSLIVIYEALTAEEMKGRVEFL